MSLRISFFKTPKHKVFTYRPIYYDPVKEEFEERIARIRAEMEQEEREKGIVSPSRDDAMGNARTREERLHFPGRSIRGSFQKALYENRRHAGDNRYIRWVVLFSIMVLLVAVVYFADGLGVLFRALSDPSMP